MDTIFQHTTKGTPMSNDHARIEQHVIFSLQEVFQKIIATDGSSIHVAYKQTNYVTSGGLFECSTSKLKTKLWVGLNGPRFFFIVYVNMREREKAQETFGFCFGGAKRVGWEFAYEPVDEDTLSIWGTLMTDKSTPLGLCEPGQASVNFTVTDEGRFWLTDIGMMAQSFIRTCERHDISAPTDKSPAPL
jgi:hypothetical protein